MNALCRFALAAVLCAAVAPAANAQQPAAPAQDPQTAPRPAPKPDPKTDPQDPRVQPAALEVKATAGTDEESALETMKVSLPCQGANSRQTVVPGADEACLGHKARGDKDGPADVSTVSARFKTLVVEVSYQRHNWPAWRVDDQSAVTAAALIGRIVQSQ